MKMQLNNRSKNAREMFGISLQRAKELFKILDIIEKENPEWHLPQILSAISQQTENENENRFLIAELFLDYGIRHTVVLGVEMAFSERSHKCEGEVPFFKEDASTLN